MKICDEFVELTTNALFLDELISRLFHCGAFYNFEYRKNIREKQFRN